MYPSYDSENSLLTVEKQTTKLFLTVPYKWAILKVSHILVVFHDKKITIFNVHVQVWFHLCPNWKYGLHLLLCLPLGHRSRWFLGWNGKERCQVSEIKYFLCRFVSKTKGEDKSRTFSKFNRQNGLKHLQRNFSKGAYRLSKEPSTKRYHPFGLKNTPEHKQNKK